VADLREKEAIRQKQLLRGENVGLEENESWALMGA